jgi:hypothetical protein
VLEGGQGDVFLLDVSPKMELLVGEVRGVKAEAVTDAGAFLRGGGVVTYLIWRGGFVKEGAGHFCERRGGY